MTMTSSVEHVLATTVADLPRQHWSDNAARLASAAIADTLAIGVAGMREPQTAQALATVSAGAGDLAAPLWLQADRYHVADAAFVSGVACHSLDWDDYMHPMHGHCSAVLLATTWPLVTRAGGSCGDLLDAFLAGYQVNYLASHLLGTAHYERGWHATSTVGTLGAAAAASRVLALDAEQTTAALAIAASFASGLRVNFGSSAKALHAGAAARHGVQAALLAAAGATASPHWLTGRYGMWETFGGEPDPLDADGLVALSQGPHGIESAWGLVQKPYCCCGSCHAAIDAVIALAMELDAPPEVIDRIEVHVDPIVPGIMRVQTPTDPSNARYCLPWAVATAAAHRAAGPAQFDVAALADQQVRQLQQRVQVIADLPATDEDRFAARVVMHARGTFRQHEVRFASGHPRNPMSDQQRRAKQLAALAPVLGEQTARSVLTHADDMASSTPLATLTGLINHS